MLYAAFFIRRTSVFGMEKLCIVQKYCNIALSSQFPFSS